MSSTPNRRRFLQLAGTSALVATGAVGQVAAKNGARAENNLVETAIALNTSGPFAGAFDTLIDAVDPRLVDLLTGNRQLTVFAPTDDAFASADVTDGDAVPVPVLAYHVTSGRRYAASVVNAKQIPTLNGARIDVADELAGNIVATDVEASNGVIHAISTVLSPE